ncbi:MAG TPA: M20/M25/M40 family metallo-hydrolase [Tepidisphaeraceae bacterium]|jgi:endoglucanase|nr:M20/M25/M40 family metallo-hydrolase [Tepidisphaeraceae bacterium]
MNTKILHTLCSTPTAPFAEQHVVRYIERFAAARPKLKLSRDPHGNLLLELPSSSPTRLVFTAHMDHPGFIADRMLDNRTLLAHFRGGVLASYLPKSKVLFFPITPTPSKGEPGRPRPVSATVLTATSDQSDRPDYPTHATLRVSQSIDPGTPGMFDQGESRIKGDKFYSRVCDDLAGAAAALTMLDILAKSKTPPQATIAVLLTRAEEEGFIGAIAASLKPRLLRKTDNLIAIETSAEQPYAPQGKGAIIRIGDRTSVFNSDLSYFLTTQAESLAKSDKSFQFQRALMPGGTCEATVYDIYGFRAASICVALGNYHNMDKQKQRIAPEYVDMNDWTNMTKLFVHLARHAHEYQPGHKLLKQRIESRYDRLKHLL